jgi:hypothetical protein
MERPKTLATWRTWVIILLVAIASIFSFGIVKLNQNIDETKKVGVEARKVGVSNNIFLGNFSDYMRCLVVNDDTVVIAVGEEVYFNLCDELLFRDTGQTHVPTKVTVPPGFPTTTTSTSTTETTGG